MRPFLVIMARFFTRPPWIQGRSHGCTVFGFLLAGICQTGATASKAFRVALWFDASVYHPSSLETRQTSRPSARLPAKGSLDTATPYHDCSHYDLVCGGDGRRPFCAVPSLLRPDSLPQATATWQGV